MLTEDDKKTSRDMFCDEAAECPTEELEEMLADYRSGFYERKLKWSECENDADAKVLSDGHIAVLELILAKRKSGEWEVGDGVRYYTVAEPKTKRNRKVRPRRVG